MGRIASATTVYATAYLTELGRQYLFNSPGKPRFENIDGVTMDRLKIERFSLGDPDINYRLPLELQSGDIPDLSGESEGAVTGAKGRTLTNLIFPKEGTFTKSDESAVVLEYSKTKDNITINLAESFANLPTIIEQQLLTIQDGKPMQGGQYTVTPTTYGDVKLNSEDKLVIRLKQPTTLNPGYRLVIFYPSSGSGIDKIKFQIEKGTVSEVVVTNNGGTTFTTTAGPPAINNTQSNL